MKEKHIIIYTFQSLEDPLVKGLILEYLKTNSSKEKIKFHIITHEQEEFSLQKEEIKEKAKELLTFNIKWYPVKYRNGAFLILKKAYNFIETFCIALRIKFNHNPVAIMGFLAIAGGYSYILSRLLRLKLIVYCFEPHSEYLVDFKIWKKNSLKYKLLKKFENLQIKESEYIVVPNNYSKVLVEKTRMLSNIFVCPISINTEQMVFDSMARKKIREKINAENKIVIIYTGKFGGIYYSADEVVGFFSKLRLQNDSLFLYVITPNVKEVETAVSKYKLPINSIYVSLTVNYAELNEHISAADIGFVALPPLPSQKYRTPVKTAIYLSCGVPYIVNKGIGDDDITALTKKVGIVIGDIEEPAETTLKKMNDLLSEKTILHQNCRKEATSTRSLASADAVLRQIFSQL